MQTNFRLKLKLATPFSLSSWLTLDSLLSAAVYNATGLVGESTIPYIPLAQRNGIFLGSSLFYGVAHRHAPVGRIMSLRGERDLSVRLFRPNGKKYVPILPNKGPYKFNMSAYPGIEAREACFWGVGDKDQAAYLISTFIPGIGKRASGGAGAIVSVAVTESETDLSWVRADGTPARPLPIDLWREIAGEATAPVAEIAVRFPYWESEKVPAVFPVRPVV